MFLGWLTLYVLPSGRQDSRKGGYYYVERLRVEDPKIKFRSNQPSRSPSICRPAPRRTPQRSNDYSSSCYWEWPEISLEQENGTTHPTYKVAFYARLETIEVSPPTTTYLWGQNNSEVATDFDFEFLMNSDFARNLVSYEVVVLNRKDWRFINLIFISANMNEYRYQPSALPSPSILTITRI